MGFEPDVLELCSEAMVSEYIEAKRTILDLCKI